MIPERILQSLGAWGKTRAIALDIQGIRKKNPCKSVMFVDNNLYIKHFYINLY